MKPEVMTVWRKPFGEVVYESTILCTNCDQVQDSRAARLRVRGDVLQPG
jgi:hypothetical protein